MHEIKLNTFLRFFVFVSLWVVSGLSSAAVIVTVTAHSGASVDQTNAPVTFGQIFKPGDVPAGTALAAQLLDGTPVPLQVDKKATHADGSLRHAILSVRQNISANAAQVIVLADSGTSTTGTDVSLSDLLAASGFDAVVTINIGGNTYEASARNLLTSETVTRKQWLKGPLVSEWIVGAPLVNTSTSAPHPHLTAYFHVRAYAGMDKVRVDVVIENNWTFATGSDKFTYDVSVKIGGVEKYTKSALGHFHHARWHKVFWWKGDPKIVVTHDANYLQESRAVPNYDDGLTVSEAKLSSMRSSVEPMENGDLRVRFGDTGFGAQIGPLSQWEAIYAVSGDKRALAASMANSTAAGTYSMHYRDENTGLPVSIANYPSLSLNGSSSVPAPGAGGNDYSHDRAHQPSLGYLSYLLSGDYYYLEEMQFWASWDLLILNDSYRQKEKGIFIGQNRAQVWGLRMLTQAAYLTPDSHPLKSFYESILQYNIEDFTAKWSAPNANNLGAIQDYDFSRGKYSPWQNDWFTWVFGYMVELGYDQAIPMRDWLSKWPTGRLGVSDSEFCFQYASQYDFYAIGPDSKDPKTYFNNFRELYEARYPAESATACDPGGEILTGYAGSSDGYIANMQPAVAIAVDAGVANDAHWTRFTQGPNAVRRRGQYNDSPIWAIVPRKTTGEPRPSITLSVTPTTLTTAGSVSVSWSTLNASSCSASGGWTGDKSLSGVEDISVSAETTFTLNCSGAGGSRTESIRVSFGATDTGGSGSTGTTKINVSATNPGDYVWGSLVTNTNVYIDRSYRYTAIPSVYQGLDVLQTANNDKGSTGDTFVSFEVDQAVTVYVAHVDGGSNLPAWLSSWTGTSDSLSTDDRGLNIYKKDFMAGTVVLGGNGGAPSMYTVFIASTGTGGSDTGGSDTGGSDTGGSDTGGSDTGGSDTGGSDTGGSDTGSADAGSAISAVQAAGGGGSLTLLSLLALLFLTTVPLRHKLPQVNIKSNMLKKTNGSRDGLDGL